EKRRESRVSPKDRNSCRKTDMQKGGRELSQVLLRFYPNRVCVCGVVCGSECCVGWCVCVFQFLLFPGLSFVQTARLSSLELLTQQLSSDTQVRFQVYRPRCQEPDKHLLLPGEPIAHRAEPQMIKRTQS